MRVRDGENAMDSVQLQPPLRTRRSVQNQAYSGLYTDMYHPDAAYVSWVTGRNGLTTFDLYSRTAPFGGAYLLLAGLEAALKFVQSFRSPPAQPHFLAPL